MIIVTTVMGEYKILIIIISIIITILKYNNSNNIILKGWENLRGSNVTNRRNREMPANGVGGGGGWQLLTMRSCLNILKSIVKKVKVCFV